MIIRLSRILMIIGVTSLVAACKLAVMVPSGGDVTSASGTRNCAGGSLCEHNITDSTFNETFTAVARPGYVFSRWSAGPGFLCADSKNPTCTISNVGTAGNAGIEAVIATGQFFYAMPLFDFVGVDTDGDGTKDHQDTDDDNDGVIDTLDNCPLVGPNLDGYGCVGNSTDYVIVNGKAWYQPDLFTNLSWNDIAAVCPPSLPANGACNTAGTLNGHDMTGFHWAYLADVAAFFSSNYGFPLMQVSSPDTLNNLGCNANWIAVWRPTGTITTDNIPHLAGLVRDTITRPLNFPLARWIEFIPCADPFWPDIVNKGTAELTDKLTNRGAWFYHN
jgi:hypothetical protein